MKFRAAFQTCEWTNSRKHAFETAMNKRVLVCKSIHTINTQTDMNVLRLSSGREHIDSHNQESQTAMNVVC
jgi:hypothetical protein